MRRGMSLLSKMPRAVRRKTIALALSDPANVPNIRKQLVKLKAAHADTAGLLQKMAETIEDTEALLGECRA